MSDSLHTTSALIFRALLCEVREKKGLTQSQLAAKVGKPQSYVSKYESGERRLDFIETEEVCAALGIGFRKFVALYDARVRKANPGTAKDA